MRKAVIVAAAAAGVWIGGGQGLAAPIQGTAGQGQQVQAPPDNGAKDKPASSPDGAKEQARTSAGGETQAGGAQEKGAGPRKDPKALTKNTYDGGFVFASEDGRFLLRLAAGAQFRYTYVKYDHDVSGNETNYSNFYFRRARLWWNGHAYSPKFTYYFHLQLEPQSAVNLHDAWIAYELHPMFQVGVGRNKIAYGLEFLNSGFGLEMISRSIMYGESDISTGGGLSRWPGGGTETLGGSAEDPSTRFPVGGMCLFRSQGVQVSGRSGTKGTVFEYQAGIWQGRDTKGASNPATGHLVAGRVGFYPTGWINWTSQGDLAHTRAFQLGLLLSAYHDTKQQKLDAAGVTVPIYDTKDRGVDVALETRYRGFSGDFEWAHEYFKLEDTTLAGPDDFGRAGWRAQAGYFVRPGFLQVVGRYAQLERLTDPTAAAALNSGLGLAKIRNQAGAFQSAVEKRLDEVTVGFNIYLTRASHQHELFFDYSHLGRDFAGFVSGSEIAGPAPRQTDDRFRAMLQIKF